MSFDERFESLRAAGKLSPATESYVKQIIDCLRADHGIVLTEDNGASFVTHICAAFGRIELGEPVQALDEVIYKDAQEEPVFSRARAIADELGHRYPQLPEPELRFITMHLGALL